MTKIDAYEGVHFEVTDHVATITLARPKSLNAMDSKVHRAIISIIDEIDDTESVKVVARSQLLPQFTGIASAGDWNWLWHAT
jgi:enoyl-CoA hydratase/carnithine racemase